MGVEGGADEPTPVVGSGAAIKDTRWGVTESQAPSFTGISREDRGNGEQTSAFERQLISAERGALQTEGALVSPSWPSPIATSPDSLPTTPRTLQDILDPTIGSWGQRLIKWYMRPRGNPERTIRHLEFLQIHRFSRVAFRFDRATGGTREHERGLRQTNYTLGGTDLRSLIDFATYRTWTNEKIHLVGLAGNSMALFGLVTLLPFVLGTGGAALWLYAGSLALDAVSAAQNVVAVLAQRYVRARLTLVINRALARGRTFHARGFFNPLGLNLPHRSGSQPPREAP